MFAKLTCVFPQLLDLYKKERLVILTTNGGSTRGPTSLLRYESYLSKLNEAEVGIQMSVSLLDLGYTIV